jgi:curved DNA-binding protein CbpA
MTHYDTLGVPSDADADTIKKAYRKASSAAHPDKGGSDEAQQALNRAMQVLGDPESRARYDATGDDKPAPTIEQQAGGMVMELFSRAVTGEDDDMLGAVRRVLAHQQAEQAAHRKLATNNVAKLTRRLKKIRRKDGKPSAVDGLIEDRIRGLNKTIERMEMALKVMARAQELVDEYESDPPVAKTRPMFTSRYFLEDA